MDSKSTKPVKKERADLPPRRGRVKAWVMGDVAEKVFSVMGVRTGKTEEGEGGESSKSTIPPAKAAARFQREKSKPEEESDHRLWFS